MSKFKYTVVDGKHQMESGEFVPKGTVVTLEKAYADKFPGKFAPVVVAEEAEEAEEAKEAKAPAAPAASK